MSIIGSVGIAEAVAEIAKVVSSYFGYEQTATERQSETRVIKGGKKQEKAIEYAEQIIFLVDDLIKEQGDKKRRRNTRN